MKLGDVRRNAAAAEPFHAVEVCIVDAVFVIAERVSLFEATDSSKSVSNPTVTADLTFGAVGAHQLLTASASILISCDSKDR